MIGAPDSNDNRGFRPISYAEMFRKTNIKEFKSRTIKRTQGFTMPEHHTVVASIHGFHLLPVTFPALPSLPSTATHFLYVAAHEPQIPTKTTPRSLFIVNVPIDATDHHIRHLLSSQLDLPHGRIEEITFEKSKHRGNINTAESNSVAGHPRGKKRKRGSYPRPVQILEESRLPSTWDRELQTNGGSAVVTFVDKASMDTVLKVVAKTIKSKKEIVWGQGLEVDLPKLGSARKPKATSLRCCHKSSYGRKVT